MVQSTYCIIIPVPIPSLPKPPFLIVLISCKHSCHFSPLRNTGYPIRKLTIHFGNRPPIKRQGKLPLTQHNVWFQKISIPPPRKGLEFPGGWGGQRPRKILRGGGGVVSIYIIFSRPVPLFLYVKFSVCILLTDPRTQTLILLTAQN